jgi:hypothetical protein
MHVIYFGKGKGEAKKQEKIPLKMDGHFRFLFGTFSVSSVSPVIVEEEEE